MWWAFLLFLASNSIIWSLSSSPPSRKGTSVNRDYSEKHSRNALLVREYRRNPSQNQRRGRSCKGAKYKEQYNEERYPTAQTPDGHRSQQKQAVTSLNTRLN